MIVNLLEETLDNLRVHGKSISDVRRVTALQDGYVVACSWQEFARQANKEYDCGYGAVEVNEDLRIEGDGWWLERKEYDGAEGWAFKTARPEPAFEGKVVVFVPF